MHVSALACEVGAKQHEKDRRVALVLSLRSKAELMNVSRRQPLIRSSSDNKERFARELGNDKKPPARLPASIPHPTGIVRNALHVTPIFG
jgi:hypothetical protein